MQTATLPVATESRDHYDHCTESCSTQAIPAAEKAYLYLVETAKPGGTMTRQGADLAVRRLHPEFATRLAAAIREAREVGLPETAIFSAYRPPAYGVGGFGDKFKSLHSYGLAVDVEGIGGPASWQAKLWHQVAASHGIVCPYGPNHGSEWNHCQATRLKMVRPDYPVRKTITADGPPDTELMFEIGNALIVKSADVSSPVAASMTGSKAPEAAQSSVSVKALASRESPTVALGASRQHKHLRATASKNATTRRPPKNHVARVGASKNHAKKSVKSAAIPLRLAAERHRSLTQ